MKKLIASFALLMAVFVLAGSVDAKPKPKISMKVARDSAVASLKAAHPSAKIKVTSSEYENEEGAWIYSFDAKVDEVVNEVWVDRDNGHVLKTEVETPKQEKEEKRWDATHKKKD